MNETLTEKLKQNHKARIPMHMPGHKRNTAFMGEDLPYSLDITEIDGFDNLHDMQSLLKETADLAASLYGARASFPLVGGSTCGILAAMHVLAPKGAHVLIARGSHKSVYNAIDLLSLTPHYLAEDADANRISQPISAERVEEALLIQKEISLVVITSPTYEGVVTNLREIAAVCKEHGVRLLVDSAHGAHFGFSPYFTESATKCGADIVVMSLHKTMPALTQTALLHLCTDDIDPLAISESLSIFETSSPSYVLLASIDECLRFINSHGAQLFSQLHENLTVFYARTKKLSHLRVFHFDDESKIIISTKQTMLSGADLAKRLRTEFSIETEMASQDFLLAIASLCDECEAFYALADALEAIDRTLTCCADAPRKNVKIPIPARRNLPSEVRGQSSVLVPFDQCEGLVCAEYVWAYPPGIPLVVPGEIISSTLLEALNEMLLCGVDLKSTKSKVQEHALSVIK